MPSPTDSSLRAPRLRTVKQVLEERPAMRTDGLHPERWVRRLIFERRLPYHRAGGRVLIDLADVDEFLERDRKEAIQ